MHERGPAMVRIALLSLLFGAFALALVQPVEAGTEATPEVQDAVGDQAVAGDGPETCLDQSCNGSSLDIVTAWIDDETAAEFRIHIRMTANVAGGQVGGMVPAGTDSYVVTFTVAGEEYEAGGSINAGEAMEPSGVASSATAAENLVTLVVPKADIGTPAAGAVMTGITVDSGRRAGPVPAPIIADSAGPGNDYIFGSGGGNTTTVPGDSDNDMLNDTCEQEFFGGLNGTNNATEDPDGDGLTNGQECASNPRTDPTKADSDGDGTSDKDDPYPTDPTKGGTSSSTNSTTGSGSTTSSTSNSGTGTGSTNSTGTDEGTGEVKTFGDAVEKLKSDIGYIGISAGGLGAVILVAILALAVRWSL